MLLVIFSFKTSISLIRAGTILPNLSAHGFQLSSLKIHLGAMLNLERTGLFDSSVISG